MKQVTIKDAPGVLNLNDKATWVLGYNAAVREQLVAVSQIDLLRECRASGQISDAQWVQHCQEHPELAAQPIADVQAEFNPSAEAIKFALEDEDGLDFLRYWNEGDFELCRRLWPDAPDEVYLGADPLFATVAHRQQQAAAKGGE